MKILQRVKDSKRIGFTMIELLIAITILGIIASGIVASTVYMIDRGKHINRTNIARTIYLAAQNSLNKTKLEKNLKSRISKYYYNYADDEFSDELIIEKNNVSIALGDKFPAEEVDNQDYIRYISKPFDYTPPASPPAISLATIDDNLLYDFYELLQEVVVDKSLLRNAILVEYNISTGAILSIFYGDGGQYEFEYMAADSDDINNVTGVRGDKYASTARKRMQGYWGAQTTGEVIDEVDTDTDIINIYDGYDVPLTVGLNQLTNILYAEFLIVNDSATYTFEIVNATTLDSLLNRTVTPGNLLTNFDDMLYHDDTYEDDTYSRYIWVIDYIEGNIYSEQANSIGVKYGIDPQNIRARATRSGSSAVSLTSVNSHYARELADNDYEIKSARHLNNIRYNLSAQFRQTADIDMSSFTNFHPLGDFTGFYSAVGDTNTQYGIYNLRISADSDDAGLFVVNQGVIQGINLVNATISGANCGVVAVENLGLIERAIVEGCSITGMDSNASVGGITALNFFGAEIYECVVKSGTKAVIIEVNALNAGGIAGQNSGVIECSGAELNGVNSTLSIVKSDLDNSYIGGIVGYNSGSILDVYFISTMSVTPISEHKDYGDDIKGYDGGGIAGYNIGLITRTFYMAFAPNTYEIITEGDDEVPPEVSATFYPIVREDGIAYEEFEEEEDEEVGVIDCFYLSGYKYSLDNGNNWPEAQINFNRADSSNYLGGGRGMLTVFIDKDWIGTAYDVALDNWMLHPIYPYPVLRGLPVPENWPEADSPGRVNQLERNNFRTQTVASDKTSGVSFVNGGFNSGLIYPGDETLYSFYNNTSNGKGWLRAYNSDTNGAGIAGGNDFWVYYDTENVPGWFTRPVEDIDPNNSNRDNWTYQLNGKLAWRSIEFQRPSPTAENGRPRITYDGKFSTAGSTDKTAFAELNAEIQGTLYQVCATEPNRQFYYSFYHLTRPPSGGADTNLQTDRMSFYLSEIDRNQAYLVENATDRQSRDANMALIRPCWSPRQYVSGSTGLNTYNAAARNSIAYGSEYRKQSGNNSSEMIYLNATLRKYWEPQDEFIGCNWAAPVYVYDVWISESTTTGYGVTFWSNSNYSIGSSGQSGTNTRIPLAGISESQYGGTTWNWLYDAQNNVFGYWGVQNGWKHYYGLYTVPSGQDSTEFAFQSNSGQSTNGNYLAGISFKSPAYVIIDKRIKNSDGEITEYAKQNDTLTVELFVQNLGEVVADNIVITDQLAPYTEYIDYLSGSVAVRKDGATITGVTIELDADNNDTLTITLPAGTPLRLGETISVSFQIRVLSELRSLPLSTILYHFVNQAEVRYMEDTTVKENNFREYQEIEHGPHASDQKKVNIDPIKLTKTISPYIDGEPFEVTLTIENALGVSIETHSGLITEYVPRAYTVSEIMQDGVPVRYVRSVNADGSSVITIKDVNLDGGAYSSITYTYKLEYNGGGYGVSANTFTSYKYIYLDDYNPDEELEISVVANFPQQMVGYTVKTQDDEFNIGRTTILNVLENDNMVLINDAGYDIESLVMLTDNAGNPAVRDGDNNYVIDTTNYRAFLNKTNNNLEFTPKTTNDGTFEIYYKIKLTASKPGSNPEVFELDSPVTKVKIVYVANEPLVYYERYDDNTYGFHAVSGVTVPATLNDTKKIIDSGYGVISAYNDQYIQLGDGEIKTGWVNANGLRLYRLEAAPADNFNLQEVKFGTSAATMIAKGKIHPNFAKAVYTNATANAGNTFYIRTPEQLQNIGLVNITGTSGKNFTQELDLNFSSLSPFTNGAVVTGLFAGVYDGGGRKITNVTINSPTLDNVGLFSQNQGRIQNVTLNPYIDITGNENVGGITGHNLTGGRVQNCTIAGTAGERIRIQGTANVGEVAGHNQGTLTTNNVTFTDAVIIP